MNTHITKVLSMAAVLIPMIAVGGGSGLVLFGASAAQADVVVYRGLPRKNATYAKVRDSEFRIDEDGLSTYEAAEFALKATTRQCKLAFTIEGVASKPEDGTHGVVTGMEGFTGTYSPNLGDETEEGHWSVNADGAAQVSFSNHALVDGNLSVNAGYTGNSNSLCNTPDAQN